MAVRDRRAPANAVLKRVKVPSAELAVCGSDGSVTASPRGAKARKGQAFYTIQRGMGAADCHALCE